VVRLQIFLHIHLLLTSFARYESYCSPKTTEIVTTGYQTQTEGGSTTTVIATYTITEPCDSTPKGENPVTTGYPSPPATPAYPTKPAEETPSYPSSPAEPPAEYPSEPAQPPAEPSSPSYPSSPAQPEGSGYSSPVTFTTSVPGSYPSSPVGGSEYPAPSSPAYPSSPVGGSAPPYPVHSSVPGAYAPSGTGSYYAPTGTGAAYPSGWVRTIMTTIQNKHLC
jgi:hypothetical protein